MVERTLSIGGAATPEAARAGGLSPAQRQEADRLERTFGVTITDSGDGTVRVSARGQGGDPSYTASVRMLDGEALTPAQIGRMEAAQDRTAASQAAFVRAEAMEAFRTEDNIRAHFAHRFGLPEDAPAVTEATERAVAEHVSRPQVFVPDGRGGLREATRPEIEALVAADERRAAAEQARDLDRPVPPAPEVSEAQRRADIATAHAYGEFTGYQGSAMDRVASVIGSVRTGFRVPAEVFARDPAHGLAGVGADRVPGGGPGGFLSDTGIAHDTDYFVGRHLAQGPLAAHAELAAQGREPSGLHGIYAAEGLTRIAALFSDDSAAAIERVETDRNTVDALNDVPNYDIGIGPWPGGWNIDWLTTREAHRGFADAR